MSEQKIHTILNCASNMHNWNSSTSSFNKSIEVCKEQYEKLIKEEVQKEYPKIRRMK